MSRVDFLGRRRVMNGSKIDSATQLINNRKAQIDSLLGQKKSSSFFKFGKMKKSKRSNGLSVEAPLRNNILKPLSKGNGEGNELDKLMKNDPLLKGKDTKDHKEDLKILEETPKEKEPETEIKESDEEQDEDQSPEEIILNLKSSYESEQIKGVTGLRKLTEVEERYIAAGVVPLLVSMLEKDHNSHLQEEALWALTNISAGRSEDIDTIFDSGGLPEIKRLLATSTDVGILEQAVWCIGNIVGDSVDHRETVLQIGMVPILEKIVPKLDSVKAQRVMAWTFCNIFRYKPIINLSDEDWDTCLRSLKHYISLDDKGTKVDACWGFTFSIEGDVGGIQKALDLGILDILSNIFDNYEEEGSNGIIVAALRVTGNLVHGNRKQIDAVVQANFIPKIVNTLSNPIQNLVKEAIWALSNLLDSEDHIQQVIDSKALPVITEKLTSASNFDHPDAKEAVWFIRKCSIKGNKKQAEELMLAGGFDALICYLRAYDSTKPRDTVEAAVEGCIKLIEKTPGEAKNLVLEDYETFESILQYLVVEDITDADRLLSNIHEMCN